MQQDAARAHAAQQDAARSGGACAAVKVRMARSRKAGLSSGCPKIEPCCDLPVAVHSTWLLMADACKETKDKERRASKLPKIEKKCGAHHSLKVSMRCLVMHATTSQGLGPQECRWRFHICGRENPESVSHITLPALSFMFAGCMRQAGLDTSAADLPCE